MVNKDYHM